MSTNLSTSFLMHRLWNMAKASLNMKRRIWRYNIDKWKRKLPNLLQSSIWKLPHEENWVPLQLVPWWVCSQCLGHREFGEPLSAQFHKHAVERFQVSCHLESLCFPHEALVRVDHETAEYNMTLTVCFNHIPPLGINANISFKTPKNL